MSNPFQYSTFGTQYDAHSAGQDNPVTGAFRAARVGNAIMFGSNGDDSESALTYGTASSIEGPVADDPIIQQLTDIILEGRSAARQVSGETSTSQVILQDSSPKSNASSTTTVIFSPQDDDVAFQKLVDEDEALRKRVEDEAFRKKWDEDKAYYEKHLAWASPFPGIDVFDAYGVQKRRRAEEAAAAERARREKAEQAAAAAAEQARQEQESQQDFASSEGCVLPDWQLRPVQQLKRPPGLKTRLHQYPPGAHARYVRKLNAIEERAAQIQQHTQPVSVEWPQLPTRPAPHNNAWGGSSLTTNNVILREMERLSARNRFQYGAQNVIPPQTIAYEMHGYGGAPAYQSFVAGATASRGRQYGRGSHGHGRGGVQVRARANVVDGETGFSEAPSTPQNTDWRALGLVPSQVSPPSANHESPSRPLTRGAKAGRRRAAHQAAHHAAQHAASVTAPIIAFRTAGILPVSKAQIDEAMLKHSVGTWNGSGYQ